MDRLLTERLEQVGNPFNNEKSGDQQGEVLQAELPRAKRGRKKQLNKNSGRPVNFHCPWDLDVRLDHYRADRKLKEHRIVERAKVVIQALDEFLTREGYPPASKNS